MSLCLLVAAMNGSSEFSPSASVDSFRMVVVEQFDTPRVCHTVLPSRLLAFVLILKLLT